MEIIVKYDDPLSVRVNNIFYADNLCLFPAFFLYT